MFNFFKKKKTVEEEQPEALAEMRALPRPTMDFTTPEGAILCLEDAYRRRDIEAAVACKDFLIEATLMLLETAPEAADDAKLRVKTAEVLELSYRKEMAETWPDMEGVESFFIEQHPYADDIFIVVEFMRMPDGSFSEANLRDRTQKMVGEFSIQFRTEWSKKALQLTRQSERPAHDPGQRPTGFSDSLT